MAKILLIEDEPDQLYLIKVRLEANKYQVLTAENGNDGIRIAIKEKPDLILMDMFLPDTHGVEVIKRLKELPITRDIPIVAITAMGTIEIEDECIRAGADDFIRKPYDSKELLEKIEKNLKKSDNHGVENIYRIMQGKSEPTAK